MKTIFITLVLIVGLCLPCGADQVTLQWDANTEADLAGYYLYRAERIGDHTLAWKRIATIPKGTTNYDDEIDEKNYAWQVTAYNMRNKESFVSNMVERYEQTQPMTLKNLRKSEP